jgi:hypothetical protein
MARFLADENFNTDDIEILVVTQKLSSRATVEAHRSCLIASLQDKFKQLDLFVCSLGEKFNFQSPEVPRYSDER